MITNTNGITIKELKEYVKDLPEQDQFGEDFEVWISDIDSTSNVCKEIHKLNNGDLLFSWHTSSTDRAQDFKS